MRETKTIRKLFFIYDFDKEENWLNEMAMQGWALIRTGFCSYTFEKCNPGEYIIRSTFVEQSYDINEYISFVENTGAEYCGRWTRWIYFRKRAEYGSFELTPDYDSKISVLNSVSNMLKIIGLANLAIGLANTVQNRFGIINLLCAMFLFYALGRIEGKKDEIKKLRTFFE